MLRFMIVLAAISTITGMNAMEALANPPPQSMIGAPTADNGATVPKAPKKRVIRPSKPKEWQRNWRLWRGQMAFAMALKKSETSVILQSVG